MLPLQNAMSLEMENLSAAVQTAVEAEVDEQMTAAVQTAIEAEVGAINAAVHTAFEAEVGAINAAVHTAFEVEVDAVSAAVQTAIEAEVGAINAAVHTAFEAEAVQQRTSLQEVRVLGHSGLGSPASLCRLVLSSSQSAVSGHERLGG